MRAIDELVSEARAEIAGATTTADLREVERKYLGKSGALRGLLKSVGAMPAEERPAFGQRVNEAAARVQAEMEARASELRAGERVAQFAAERLDVSLPGRRRRVGNPHILQQTTDRIKEVFVGLGFEYLESPELEQFRYNFDALNYPEDHPAMDEQDTFYVEGDLLLRTQCTALQGRVFENRKPPIRAFTVGRTFRNEAVDRTHGHTFHQVDVFMVDEGVSMAHLKWTLGTFARAMLGPEVKIRFRPDFFPFVEPGVDYAISTPKFAGGRWLELGGAGLVHPNILEHYGIDSERYSGFAFGLGVERLPMLRYGVDDLRHFLENDLRFLEQFPA
ncbi:MAG: phenylalanine--tRNA ligase subunit alpha [Fimbriimonadaceae bacterium]|nr:phenylalanine--tRNA ligase subunit alpha [Fimbriimonadaceae bacterium]